LYHLALVCFSNKDDYAELLNSFEFSFVMRVTLSNLVKLYTKKKKDFHLGNLSFSI